MNMTNEADEARANFLALLVLGFLAKELADESIRTGSLALEKAKGMLDKLTTP